MVTINKAEIAAVVMLSMMTFVRTGWSQQPLPPQAPKPRTQWVALAPFMRWNGDIPQLELDKQWYELVKLNDLPIVRFMDTAKKLDLTLWQRVFQEDLDEVFASMRLPFGPFKLELRRLGTGQAVTIDHAPVTEENRRSLIWGDQKDTTQSTTALFSAIRWQTATAQVQVNGDDTWYILNGIDGQPAAEIVDFARRTYPLHWQAELEHNTVEVLLTMGHLFPPGVAMLQLQTLDTDKPVEISKRTHDLKYKPAGGQGYPRVSPFSAVRWRDSDYEVQLSRTWYKLVSINDQPIEKIVEFCRKRYGDDMAHKRIDEDLVEVLTTMGLKPTDSLKLQLRTLDTGELITREKVVMTAENRRKIMRSPQPNVPPAIPAPGTTGL